MQGEGLSGPLQVEVPPNEKKQYEYYFYPFYEFELNGNIAFVNS